MLGLGLRLGYMRMRRKEQLAHGCVCLCCLLICEGGVSHVALRTFCMKVLWVSRKPQLQSDRALSRELGSTWPCPCLCPQSCRCPGLLGPLKTKQLRI